jgi:hypothetical protein
MKMKTACALAVFLLVFGCIAAPSQKVIDDCKGLNEGLQKEGCYLRLAQKSNQSIFCENINTTSFSVTCYSVVAKNTGDTALCQKIDSLEDRAKCVNSIGVNKP